MSLEATPARTASTVLPMELSATTTTIEDVVPATAAGRIPSLDGLRAISIAAVLLGHLAGSTNFPTAIGDIVRDNGFVDFANFGVTVFFVISGFLITGILMKESQRPGGVSLRRFYLRRTMRIFPAYYVFIASVVGLTAIGIVSVTSQDIGHALTYTINYYPDRSWDVGHLWSLAVEEQFYLLWPVAIVLLGLRNAKAAALAVVVAAPLFRAFEYEFLPRGADLIGNTFETTADAIAMGCLLALTLDQLAKQARFRQIIASPWLIIALLGVALLLGRWGPSRLLVSISLTNVAIALAVAYCVLRPRSRTGRFLNLRPLVFVGTLSYSIYLWQQIFINRNSTSIISTFPVDLILVGACALGSYYLVERPFLRWRPRVEQRLLGTAPRTPTPSPVTPQL
jgi:peptidoglycan/LPS O-acetylase OafA/YrhL